MGFLAILARVIVAFLDLLQLFMIGRAIMSWFPLGNENVIVRFLYIVTEPAVIPVRALFRKFGWFQGIPIDVSFMITFLLLSLLQVFGNFLL